MTHVTERDLPALDDERATPPDVVADFRDKGHVVVRGLASAEEMAAWSPVVRDVAMATNTETRPLSERDYYARAVLQMQNLWRRDERVRRFVFAPRFARVAADLLGVDAVRMYHDQAVFKEPGSTPTPYHQDQYYFPLDGEAVVTMWMPLAPISAEMGTMTFAAGSHQHGNLGSYEISDEAHALFEDVIAEKGFSLETHGAMAPGDSTFHASWTLHAAPANVTNDWREVMTIIWFADGLRGIEPAHDWHLKDYEKWLPGVRPGGPAAGPLNPVVWRRS